MLSFWEKELFLAPCDFLVVGGGIVGISTAIEIKRSNPSARVLLIERGQLPNGASTKNAGFACIGSPGEILSDLETQTRDAVLENVEKRYRGLLLLRELLGDKALEYTDNPGYELFDSETKDRYVSVMENLESLNRGFKNITGLSRSFQPANDILSKFGLKGYDFAIKLCCEGQINPAKMMQSLYKLAREKDVEVLMGVECLEFGSNELHTNLGSISFSNLFITVNGFAKKLLPKLDVSPARAQVLITSPIKALKLKGSFHYNDGYYYFRNVGQRVLFGGGRNLDIEGERTTEITLSDLIQSELLKRLKNNILPSQDFQIDHQWSGIMGTGKNKSPIIKSIKENIFLGVRLGGMGVAIGTLVGKELASLVK